MLRLLRDAARAREDAETAASARLLQTWTRAIVRDRVLRGKPPSSFLGPNPIERPKA